MVYLIHFDKAAQWGGGSFDDTFTHERRKMPTLRKTSP